MGIEDVFALVEVHLGLQKESEDLVMLEVVK
jgi:hypothetical protein